MTIRIHTIEGVSNAIEELMWKHDIDIIDAILQHCEDEQIEFASIGKLLDSKLKKALEAEARKLNMLVKEK